MAPNLDDYAAVRRRRFPAGAPVSCPLVSVVTVCRDAAATLGRTIDSIHAQDLAGVEHMIVDGASRDGTVELARGRLRQGDYLVSEPDAGISDALNKGVALAAGRYLQFVHADDWLEPGQLALAVAAIEAVDAAFVFGDLVFHEAGRPSFLFRGDPSYERVIHRRMPSLNHPTVLARRDTFERFGLFDQRYRCAMDYDWFLRLHLAGIRGRYVPELRGNMSHDGVSNLRFARTMREVARIAQEHGRPALLAQPEMAYQVAKIGLGRMVKRHAAPLYRQARRLINRSYVPIDTARP